MSLTLLPSSLARSAAARAVAGFSSLASPSLATATSSSCSSSSSSLASTSFCHPSSSVVQPAVSRSFSSSPRALGKSRPGEGKDARKAARRRERLEKMGISAEEQTTEEYTLEEAVRLLKAIEVSRPWAAIELHLATSVPRMKSNALRGRVNLPHSAKTEPPTLLIFAPDGSPTAAAAKKYQASHPSVKIIVGGEDLVKDVANNQVRGFDKVLADASLQSTISRHLARSLGPQGLMPNAKRGTVASTEENMTGAIEEAVSAVDWRSDRSAFVRAAVGRATFTLDEVRDNTRELLSSVMEKATSSTLGGGKSGSSDKSESGFKLPQRPPGVPAPPDVIKRAQGVFLRMHLSSTQGPGIRLSVADVI